MTARSDSALPEHRVPAPAAKQSQDFQSELIRFLEDRLDAELDTLISRENRYRLSHGSGWGSLADPDDEPGKFETATAEVVVSFEAVATQNLGAFRASIDAIAEQMARTVIGGLFSTVSEAADRVGNSVSASEQGSNAAAFLEMLRKIEFGVDSQGRVTFPSLHVGPGVAEKLLAELEAQGPEFHEEVRRLQTEKAKAALARDRDRRSRYRR
jgi:hypothetical protein